MGSLMISPGEMLYIGGWLVACVVAIGLMVVHRHTLTLFGAGYRAYLLQAWKVVTFAIAATGMVVIAPWTGDPTWDYVDAGFMALLTFLTAPWSVGTLYLGLRRQSGLVALYVAACLWLFSASWSYDGYILLRDGYYPPTWLPNLFASSVLYCAAGLLWNLEWHPERGVVFGFMRPGWPVPAGAGGFLRVMLYALPFMLIAGAMIGAFLL